jgi:hypothetical protein
METGTLAEISLIAFVVGFGLILVRVFTLPKKEMEDGKQMPLDEPEEQYHNWSDQLSSNGSPTVRH